MSDNMVFMTPDETAKLLRLSKLTIYKMCEKGDIPGVKIGSSWRIRRDQLLEKYKIVEKNEQD